jgi:hypothetical protein
MRWKKHVVCKILGADVAWKRSLWRPNHRWEVNVEMDFIERGSVLTCLIVLKTSLNSFTLKATNLF